MSLGRHNGSRFSRLDRPRLLLLDRNALGGSIGFLTAIHEPANDDGAPSNGAASRQSGKRHDPAPIVAANEANYRPTPPAKRKGIRGVFRLAEHFRYLLGARSLSCRVFPSLSHASDAHAA